MIHAVWGYSEAGDSRLVKHLVFRLRQKIETDHKKPKYIKTESGVGYKFEFEDV
jgi:two-component system alkaline phosphatase synthesis response regulator PhoP